jgi:hypothetical protein
MKLNLFVYITLAIIILYLLRVQLIVQFITDFMVTWNYGVDYILNLKDKQPLIFLALPLLLLWLMRGK